MDVVELKKLEKRFGSVVAVSDVSFRVRQGQCVSLLGPSGCGKTTTLRMIAGFESPDKGEVLIAGQNMRGVEPYDRNVALVFQDYALFPHMSVEENIAFGMRHRGFERRLIPDRTRSILKLVKLMGYEKRRPSQLSGGEQQRVALARSLVTEPAVLLLDEPLSNLDAKLRQELRLELKDILRSVGTTAIIVTHDQEEAMSLADHIILMERGRIVQEGRPLEIYSAPQTRFAAEFIGKSNWFEGELQHEISRDVWRCQTVEGIQLLVKRPSGVDKWKRIEIGVRPERIRIVRGKEPEANHQLRNRISGTVDHIENLGSDLYIWIQMACGRRIQTVEKNLGQSGERPGTPISAWFEIEDCIVVRPDKS